MARTPKPATPETQTPAPPAPAAQAAPPPAPPAGTKTIGESTGAPAQNGTFCGIERFGGGEKEYGCKIEEPGDVYPGLIIKCRRKDGQVKEVRILEVLHADHYKVVCAIEPADPNDVPPSARRGATTLGGAGTEGRTRLGLSATEIGGVDSDDDNPRGTRDGSVEFSGPGPLRIGSRRSGRHEFVSATLVRGLDPDFDFEPDASNIFPQDMGD